MPPTIFPTNAASKDLRSVAVANNLVDTLAQTLTGTNTLLSKLQPGSTSCRCWQFWQRKNICTLCLLVSPRVFNSNGNICSKVWQALKSFFLQWASGDGNCWHFLPAIFDKAMNVTVCGLTSLPFKCAGLAIANPVTSCLANRNVSTLLTSCLSQTVQRKKDFSFLDHRNICTSVCVTSNT